MIVIGIYSTCVVIGLINLYQGFRGTEIISLEKLLLNLLVILCPFVNCLRAGSVVMMWIKGVSFKNPTYKTPIEVDSEGNEIIQLEVVDDE